MQFDDQTLAARIQAVQDLQGTDGYRQATQYMQQKMIEERANEILAAATPAAPEQPEAADGHTTDEHTEEGQE